MYVQLLHELIPVLVESKIGDFAAPETTWEVDSLTYDEVIMTSAASNKFKPRASKSSSKGNKKGLQNVLVSLASSASKKRKSGVKSSKQETAAPESDAARDVGEGPSEQISLAPDIILQNNPAPRKNTTAQNSKYV